MLLRMFAPLLSSFFLPIPYSLGTVRSIVKGRPAMLKMTLLTIYFSQMSYGQGFPVTIFTGRLALIASPLIFQSLFLREVQRG